MTDKPFKDKKGKLPFHLIPPELDKSYAEVAQFGIEKLKRLGVTNPERNWEKGLKLLEDHGAACERHYNLWKSGIDLDAESGLHHLKHALWHLTAIVTQVERGRTDLDDRPSSKSMNGSTTPFLSQWKNKEIDSYQKPYSLMSDEETEEYLQQEEAYKKTVNSSLDKLYRYNQNLQKEILGENCRTMEEHLELQKLKSNRYFKKPGDQE